MESNGYSNAVEDLRVLHVLDHSLPLHSGYTFRTASILREQVKRGWKTFHLTSPKHLNSKDPEEEASGLHFYRTVEEPGVMAHLPGLSELDLMKRTERRLLEVARAVRPHILHAHSPALNAWPAIRVGRALGIPVVYEIRAFWEDAAVDHGTTTQGSVRYRLTRAMESQALRQVQHCFTICEGLRQDIVARGIAPEKVTVIPNAVDSEAFEMGAAPDPVLKHELGLSGATVLGFIGSFYGYEGLDLLLKALLGLLKRRPETRLLLVGGGPQDQQLRAMAASLGLSDKVVFTGRVPHAEVARYYDLIDVLCYPRHPMRLTELVTPLKPLEAMAQGRVMVASDVGGHRELIEHGVTGQLFAAGNVDSLIESIDDLLHRRVGWDDIRLAGRRFVESKRTWKNSVERYAQPYLQLARGVSA